MKPQINKFNKSLQTKNKKAFEIQFNWLFVLAAGAAILIFFTVILVKQKSVSEASVRVNVIKSLEAIITGAGISKDTINLIDMPDSVIEIGCNKVSLGGTSKQYQNLVLFAPSLLKGKRLVTQTTAFSVPYRATNLLYITSLDVRYIIIGSSALAKAMNNSLPSDLKKEIYSTAPLSFQNKNNYNVRFIVFDRADLESIDLTKFDKMEDSDVTALSVIGDINSGTIEFYQKDGISWTSKRDSYYITKSSLLGAVYSEASEAYECSMRNALSRLTLVNKIYISRTKTLRDNAVLNSNIACADLYGRALIELDNIGRASSELSDTNIGALINAAGSLAELNKDAQLNSCPLIY